MDMRPGPRLGDDIPMRVGLVEWARSFGDIREQWADAQARMSLLTDRPGWQTSDWTEGERVVSGVWCAAVWTIGDRSQAPVTHKDLPVTWPNVEREMSLAYTFRNDPRHGFDALYMAGAHSWLQWISGDAAHMVYPVAADTPGLTHGRPRIRR